MKISSSISSNTNASLCNPNTIKIKLNTTKSIIRFIEKKFMLDLSIGKRWLFVYLKVSVV